jgi:hypothetical protein
MKPFQDIHEQLPGKFHGLDYLHIENEKMNTLFFYDIKTCDAILYRIKKIS